MAEKSDKLKNMSEEELNARHAEKMKKEKGCARQDHRHQNH